jgi:hypothetical protein
MAQPQSDQLRELFGFADHAWVHLLRRLAEALPTRAATGLKFNDQRLLEFTILLT